MPPGHVPEDIERRYEVYDFCHAAAILITEFPQEAQEVWTVLRTFRLTERQVLRAGGNESEIPKEFSKILKPLGWKTAKMKAKLVIDDEEISSDTHKVDYVKNKIAF